MTWQWSPLLIPLLGGAIASFATAIYWWRSNSRISKTGSFLLVASGFWILGSALEVVGGDFHTKLVMSKIQYIGICFLPVSWLIISSQFSGRDTWQTPGNIVAIMFIPILTLCLAFTNERHGIMWKDAKLLGDSLYLIKSQGVGFFLLLLYSYLVVGVGIFFTITMLIQTRRLYRWQAFTFLITVLSALFTHIIFDKFGSGTILTIELTPFFLSIVVPPITWGLIRLHEEVALPIAKETLVRNMRDGLVVLDLEGLIVDINPAAQKLFNSTNKEIIGTQVDQYSDDLAVLIKNNHDQERDIVLEIDGKLRSFSCEFSPVVDHHDRLICRILIFRDVTERVRTEIELRDSLEEKEALLKEVHHRVKNNLQVITSLLNLQISHIADEGAIAEIKESQNRIFSMAFVHEQLYQSDDVGQVDFGSYIHSLVSYLFEVYRRGDMNIRLDIQSEMVILDIDTAIPCGLIINELVTNVFKHAFPTASSGKLTLKLWLESGDQVHMLVKDNGIGFPPNLDTQNTTSLGFQLIHLLLT